MTDQINAGDIPPARLDDCVAVVTGAAGLNLAESDILSVTRQTGGLFNFLLRVETGKGLFFFKQYLDGVPNATFKPPEIPASRRAELAYEVQREATEATASREDVVPPIVHFDRRRSAFLMRPANGERPLIELLSSGEIPEVAVTQLPRALGSLHQATYGKHQPPSLYDNVRFRDFKLNLQYDDIAARLEPAESEAVLTCKKLYQNRQVCVTHGDPNSRNVVVGEKTMGLFDFEQSHLGSPAYDIAYLLSEYFIAAETFGRRPEHVADINAFLDNYFEVFTAEERTDVELETTHHLAVQIIYRFWGPSRASWTFYVPDADKERIVASARRILAREPQPVSRLLMSPDVQEARISD